MTNKKGKAKLQRNNMESQKNIYNKEDMIRGNQTEEVDVQSAEKKRSERLGRKNTKMILKKIQTMV